MAVVVAMAVTGIVRSAVEVVIVAMVVIVARTGILVAVGTTWADRGTRWLCADINTV